MDGKFGWLNITYKYVIIICVINFQRSSMATGKPTDDFKNGPSNSGEDDERELTDAELVTMMNLQAEQTRTLLLEQGGQPVRAAEQNLHFLVETLLARCERDPEVVVLLTRLLGKLGNLASFGQSVDQLSDSKLRELRAVLIGATMASEGYRRAAYPEVQPASHAPNVRLFLDLVEERVGKKNDDGTTTLQMRISEDQIGGGIRYKKP